jgi:anti-anti-sigma regulatory factor
MEPFQSVRTSSREGARVLHLDGVLNIAADALYAAARELLEHGENVAIDCSRADHLEGPALQILLALKHGLARKSRSMWLEGVQPELARCITSAGLGPELLRKEGISAPPLRRAQ